MNLWTQHIAWRFSRYRVLFAYWRYLKNYKEAFELREKKLPVKLQFRCGLVLDFSNAASSLHIFDEIFVNEVYKLRKSLQAKTIVDVGANVGLFSIYALLKTPKAKIYAIEADPVVFQELSKNFQANKLTNKIQIFNLAMTSTPGKIILYRAAHSGWSSLFDDLGAKAGLRVEVDATNLSLFCKKYNLEKIDYLKVDIEGAEYDFILGDRDFFHNGVERMTVEVDKQPRDKRYSFDDLINKIKENYATVQTSLVSDLYPLLYCSEKKKISPKK